MSDEYSLDGGGDLFEGDMGFDDDFSSGSKNSFLKSFATGFFGGLVSETVGSADAMIRTARVTLPKSFSNFLDKVKFLNDKTEELVTEFKQRNYTSVKTLQTIAGKIGKYSTSAERFAGIDFSDWEKKNYSDAGESGIYQENVSENELVSQFAALGKMQLEGQNEISQRENELAANVGGATVAAIQTGNTQLVGAQLKIKELVDYQRNVQFKMDNAKIELLARTYLVNGKYYKFMEKALHASVDELKKISMYTKMSDMEKTSFFDETKDHIRKGLLGLTASKAGGFLKKAQERFGKDGRRTIYNNIEQKLVRLLGGVEEASQIPAMLNREMVGMMLGNFVASQVTSNIPKIVNLEPIKNFGRNLIDNDPDVEAKIIEKYKRLDEIGNIFSHGVNNIPELLNYYSKHFEQLDESDYAGGYDKYVEKMKKEGKEAWPKFIYDSMQGLKRQVFGKINTFMSEVDKSEGTVFTLEKRNAKQLTQISQWREINNITLNDVIPGWLSRIYESLERARTGNDDFKSPVFSYTLGQYVSEDKAMALLKNDVLGYSKFSAAASKAHSLVDALDDDEKQKVLTKQQKDDFALKLLSDADKGDGFRPFSYIGEIEGLSKETSEAINKLIIKKFNLTEEDIKEYNESSTIKRMSKDFMKSSSVIAAADELQKAMPDISETFTSNRQAGNEQLLRKMGLIVTKDGADQFDMDLFWKYLETHIRDPNSAELRGDITNIGEDYAGPTINAQKGKGRPKGPGSQKKPSTKGIEETNKAFAKSVKMLSGSVDKLTDIFDKQKEGLKIDLADIPDSVSVIKDLVGIINSRGDKELALLEEISEGVSRQAGGWNGRSKREREKITRDEKDAKKGIIGKLKSLYPKDLINEGLETLIRYQPAILSGALAAMGGYGLMGKKGALIGGAVGAAGAMIGAYGKLSQYARAQMPDDDENIYDENGEILLHAYKLKARDYYDAASKRIIQSWRDIKGAVYDGAKRIYITVAQLTGKIFGPDGRALVIKGLSKIRDKVTEVFSRFDPAEIFKKGLDAGKKFIFQKDIYVKGEYTPRITKQGWKNQRYYLLDKFTNKPKLINGFNEITGPVYELDDDGNLNLIITEEDFAQGLITAGGIAINKIVELTKFASGKAILGLLTAKNYAVNKAGQLADKINFSTDMTGVESRLDKIYDLLTLRYKGESFREGEDGTKEPQHTNPEPEVKKEAEFTKEGQPTDDVVNEAINKKESAYPKKIRLNSLEDQKIQEEERKKDQFYDDISSIRKNMDDSKKDKDKGKDKKSILGKLAAVLLGGAGLVKKMFTNPLGFMADVTGFALKTFFKMLFGSSQRLVKIGSLLFRGVFGASSMMYKLLAAGFAGVITAVRTMANGELWSSLLGGGKKVLSKAGDALKIFMSKLKIGKVAKYVVPAAATGGLLYAGSSYAGENKSVPTGPDGLPIEIKDTQSPTNDPSYNKRQLDNDNIFAAIDNEELPEEKFTNPFTVLQEGTPDSIIPEPAESNNYTSLATDAALTFGPSLLSKGVNGTKVGAEAMTRLAAKAGLKGAGHAVPILGQALMAYDGITGFTDGEETARVYNTNYINGSERLANGYANILDMGGVFSGGMTALADATGIEAFRPEGGMTRAIGKMIDSGGLGILGFLGSKILGNWESDMSSPQRKIRLALYGVDYNNTELGRLVEVLESELSKYTTVDTKGVRIDSRAPIGQLLTPLSSDNRKSIVEWYKGRFEPVFKAWLMACKNVGFNHYLDCDSDKNGFAIKTIERTKAAVTTMTPYPLDVPVIFTGNVVGLNKDQTEKLIESLLVELKKEMKDKGYDEKGDVILSDKIKTEKEIRDEMAKDVETGKANGFFYTPPIDDKKYPQPAAILSIDISDLHKDGATNIDELTMVRLAAYGNTKNNPLNVDTVLKLERYCEDMFSILGVELAFIGNTNEIFNLFKNTFRLQEEWSGIWVKWFNLRFIPVLTVWCNEVSKRKRALPNKCWTTLIPEAKYEIARALIETKVDHEGEFIPIWKVEYSPFTNTESGTDSLIVNAEIESLAKKAYSYEISSNRLEEKTDKLEGNDKRPALTPTQQKALEEKLNGGIGITDKDFEDAAGYNVANNNFGMGGGGSNDPTNYLNTSGGSDYSNGTPPPISSAGEQPILSNYDPKDVELNKKAIISEFIKAGYTDPKIIAYALANAEVESSLTNISESLDYPADSSIFNKGYPGLTPENGRKYGRTATRPADQHAIAEVNRGGRLGNGKGNGDAWKFRGRGFTQLTWKDNYKYIGNKLGVDLVSDPDALLRDPFLSARATVEYFKWRGIPESVLNGKIKKAIEAVGGAFGSDKKMSNYAKYLKQINSGQIKLQTFDQKLPTQPATGPETEGNKNENQQTASGTDSQRSTAESQGSGATSTNTSTTTTPNTNTAGSGQTGAAMSESGGTNQTDSTKRAIQTAAANDTAAQAATKINLPTQNSKGNDSVSSAQINKVEPFTPIAPEHKTKTTSSHKEEDKEKPIVQHIVEKPIVAEVKMPKGTMSVHDEKLASTIGHLAKAIDKLADKQQQPNSQLTASNRRVNVGSRRDV